MYEKKKLGELCLATLGWKTIEFCLYLQNQRRHWGKFIGHDKCVYPFYVILMWWFNVYTPENFNNFTKVNYFGKIWHGTRRGRMESECGLYLGPSGKIIWLAYSITQKIKEIEGGNNCVAFRKTNLKFSFFLIDRKSL